MEDDQRDVQGSSEGSASLVLQDPNNDQGYEVSEEETRVSLDEFKSRFTNSGLPE
jgi:hypothetical protein